LGITGRYVFPIIDLLRRFKMNIENDRNNITQDNATKHDAEAKFHLAFGWLAALSVSIATAALATIS
jgi:hypothetical protein